MKQLLAICLGVLFLASACHHKGVHSASKSYYNAAETGDASYYSDQFEGRPTANGEVFHQNKLTAAHRTLPFGTMVKVTNLINGKTVMVRINDRGPFTKNRLIDLSKAAANQLDLLRFGVVKVTIAYHR